MTTVADPGALYGLPLEEFITARNALAKDLNARGEREAAAEVKSLRKPSRTAWALNQVARQRPGDVERLVALGAAVREAQEQALAGDATRLRAATRDEQEQVNLLADAAASLLGGGPTVADRLRSTLRAAATDPGASALLSEGRLATDIEASGFGLEQMSSTLPERPQVARREEREAEKEVARLQAEAEKARKRARRVLDEADRAAQRAQEAHREAEAAEDDAVAAERAAFDAADHLAGLRRGQR